MEIVFWFIGILAACACGWIVHKYNDTEFDRARIVGMFAIIYVSMIMASVIKNPGISSVWVTLAIFLIIIIGAAALAGSAVLMYNYQKIDRLDPFLEGVVPLSVVGLILTYPGNALGLLKWIGVF